MGKLGGESGGDAGNEFVVELNGAGVVDGEDGDDADFGGIEGGLAAGEGESGDGNDGERGGGDEPERSAAGFSGGGRSGDCGSDPGDEIGSGAGDVEADVGFGEEEVKVDGIGGAFSFVVVLELAAEAFEFGAVVGIEGGARGGAVGFDTGFEEAAQARGFGESGAGEDLAAHAAGKLGRERAIREWLVWHCGRDEFSLANVRGFQQQCAQMFGEREGGGGFPALLAHLRNGLAEDVDDFGAVELGGGFFELSFEEDEAEGVFEGADLGVAREAVFLEDGAGAGDGGFGVAGGGQDGAEISGVAAAQIGFPFEVALAAGRVFGAGEGPAADVVGAGGELEFFGGIGAEAKDPFGHEFGVGLFFRAEDAADEEGVGIEGVGGVDEDEGGLEAGGHGYRVTDGYGGSGDGLR